MTAKNQTPGRPLLLLARVCQVLMATLAVMSSYAWGAATYDFAHIADTLVLAPGSSPLQNYSSFSNAALTGVAVSFEALPTGVYGGSGTTAGIAWNTGFSAVVQSVHPELTTFGPPSADNSAIAFKAADSNGTSSRAVLMKFDPVTGLVAYITYIPSGTFLAGVTLTGIGNPTISSGIFAFKGSTSGGDALFIIATDQSTGAITYASRFADTGVAGQFNSIGDPSINGNTLSFLAVSKASPNEAIYTQTFNTNTGVLLELSRVAAIGDPAPGGGTIVSFGAPSTDGNGKAVFSATTSDGRTGIYSSYWNGSTVVLSLMVDTTAAIPGGTGNFVAFGAPSAYDDIMAFLGLGGSGQIGIYRWEAGVLTDVVDLNDLLFGKILGELQFGSEGLDGTSLGFVAGYVDGSAEVVRADLVGPSSVPEPTSLALLGLGIAGLLISRRRNCTARQGSDRILILPNGDLGLLRPFLGVGLSLKRLGNGVGTVETDPHAIAYESIGRDPPVDSGHGNDSSALNTLGPYNDEPIRCAADYVAVAERAF